jgi:curved DNA-binding protein CbpA
VKDIMGDLSGRRTGAEVLCAIGRVRAEGVLEWLEQSSLVRFHFKGGRPERVEAPDLAGSGGSRDRAQVVKRLRAMACAVAGQYRFNPTAVEVGDPLLVDTLGETLFAVLSSMAPSQLAEVWQARRDFALERASSFMPVRAAAIRLGAADPEGLSSRPSSELTAGSLDVQRCLAGMLFLGAMRVKPATTAVAGSPANSTSGVGRASGDGEMPPELPEDAGSQPTTDAGANVPKELLAEIDAAYVRLSTQTHYDALGITPKATAEEVRAAYFERAKRWHSDTFVGMQLGSAHAKVEALFRRIGEANEVLSNPAERQAYDVVLARKAQGLPTDGMQILQAEALFKKAQGLVRRGQAAAALPMLEEAVQLNAGEPEFLAFLGFALYGTKGSEALEAAKQHLHKALSMREALDVAYEFLGRIAHAEGKKDEATRALRKAIELNPKNREAVRELRLISMRAGKNGEAEGGLFDKLLKRKKKKEEAKEEDEEEG